MKLHAVHERTRWQLLFERGLVRNYENTCYMKYHIGNQRCSSFQDGGLFLYQAYCVFVIASKVPLEVERMYSDWPFEQFLRCFRYGVLFFRLTAAYPIKKAMQIMWRLRSQTAFCFCSQNIFLYLSVCKNYSSDEYALWTIFGVDRKSTKSQPNQPALCVCYQLAPGVGPC